MIGFFSPKAQLSRIAARERVQAYKAAGSLKQNYFRKYEGAAKGRRTEGWHAPSTSANTEARRDMITLRNRARDLVRNNPYAQRAIRVIATNTVGQGVRANIVGKTGVQAALFNELWTRWANSTIVDFDGRLNFYAMQKQIMEAVAESGEVLIRKRYRDTAGQPVPLRLQILESDFIANNLHAGDVNGGNKVLQGIEFDPQGMIVAYHIYTQHPGNVDGILSTRFSTERIPASEIVHVFRADRPGQYRGITWLAPIMLRLRDFDDFEDAQLVRQKIAACFSVFVQDVEGLDPVTAENHGNDLAEKVEPGIIEVLPPGKSVSFANPPGVEGYSEYSSTLLHSIATGMGISFEALTGDLSQVNFSSARMGFLEFQRNIDAWRGCLLNPQFNDPVFQWFLEASRFAGLNPQGVQVNWIAPRREMIDPTKEVPATIKALRAGIETLDDVILRNGKDPRKHLEQIAANNKILDELGIIVDSDARKLSAIGYDPNFETDPNEDGDSEGKQLDA